MEKIVEEEKIKKGILSRIIKDSLSKQKWQLLKQECQEWAVPNENDDRSGLLKLSLTFLSNFLLRLVNNPEEEKLKTYSEMGLLSRELETRDLLVAKLYKTNRIAEYIQLPSFLENFGGQLTTAAAYNSLKHHSRSMEELTEFVHMIHGYEQFIAQTFEASVKVVLEVLNEIGREKGWIE